MCMQTERQIIALTMSSKSSSLLFETTQVPGTFLVSGEDTSTSTSLKDTPGDDMIEYLMSRRSELFQCQKQKHRSQNFQTAAPQTHRRQHRQQKRDHKNTAPHTHTHHHILFDCIWHYYYTKNLNLKERLLVVMTVTVVGQEDATAEHVRPYLSRLCVVLFSSLKEEINYESIVSCTSTSERLIIMAAMSSETTLRDYMLGEFKRRHALSTLRKELQETMPEKYVNLWWCKDEALREIRKQFVASTNHCVIDCFLGDDAARSVAAEVREANEDKLLTTDGMLTFQGHNTSVRTDVLG